MVSKYSVGSSWPSLITHSPPLNTSPSASPEARAIGPAALPTASTKTRRGLKVSSPAFTHPSSTLRERRMVLPGSAAASAAFMISLSSFFIHRYHKHLDHLAKALVRKYCGTKPRLLPRKRRGSHQG